MSGRVADTRPIPLHERRVPTAYLRLALDELIGADPGSRAQVVAAAGLRPEDLARGGRAEIDFGSLAAAVTIAAANRPTGWHLGLIPRLEAAVHGPLGFALLAAPTLGDAVETLIAYGELRMPFVWFASSVERGSARVECTPSGDLGELRTPLMEVTVLSVARLVTQVSGRPASRIVVHLPGEPPAHEAALQRAAGALVRFGAEGFAAEFPSSWLSDPSLFADEDMYRLSISRCVDLLGAGTSRSPLERSLRRDLLAMGGISPGLEALARSRHMSSRTLMRRLKQQGTSYRQVVDEIHAGLAADLLRHTELPVAEIAARLGFADPANFGRAFRRWHGMTPGRFRRR